MASDTTQRVKRHRIERGVVRVEVEVPSAEDAAAVRRFARERREANRRARPAASPTDRHDDDAGETLADVIERIGPNAMPALRVFAAGLAITRTPDLIARAERIARNYTDVARMQDHPGVRGGEGRGD